MLYARLVGQLQKFQTLNWLGTNWSFNNTFNGFLHVDLLKGSLTTTYDVEGFPHHHVRGLKVFQQ